MKRISGGLQPGEDILLFFKDYLRDRFFPGDRYLRLAVRPLLNLVRKGPKGVTGFFMWYRLLVQALRSSGYRVHLNDYRLAESNPHYPVGLVGYPDLLAAWSLPNPALLGPSLFDHPKDALQLFDNPHYHLYIVTCDWMQQMFAPYYGERCVQWYAGMDLSRWSGRGSSAIDTDVLIYDKIRWHRAEQQAALLEPLEFHLKQRGLSYRFIRYGGHDHKDYREALERSRAMVFLCEHETQGLAYQEALACDVPILAWDNGFWLDPKRPRFEPDPVPATSVPYFSAECGERFATIEELPSALDRFWSRLSTYAPRRYVERELSFEGSARIYSDYYFSLT